MYILYVMRYQVSEERKAREKELHERRNAVQVRWKEGAATLRREGEGEGIGGVCAGARGSDSREGGRLSMVNGRTVCQAREEMHTRMLEREKVRQEIVLEAKGDLNDAAEQVGVRHVAQPTPSAGDPLP